MHFKLLDLKKNNSHRKKMDLSRYIIVKSVGNFSRYVQKFSVIGKILKNVIFSNHSFSPFTLLIYRCLPRVLIVDGALTIRFLNYLIVDKLLVAYLKD